jgi:hypothetical protein
MTTCCGISESWVFDQVEYLLLRIHGLPSLQVIHAPWRPSDGKNHAGIHRLLFFRDILGGVGKKWANLVGISGCQGLNLLAVHPGNIEAGLICGHFLKTLLSQTATVKYIHHTCWTFICKFRSAEHTSSLQVVLDSSNDEDYAHATGECHGNNGCGNALGSYSKGICLNVSCALHGVACVVILSQVASQGFAIVTAHAGRYKY